MLLAVLVACSDYDVAHSDLSAASESDEVFLADGDAATLVMKASADADAMGANPTTYVKATIFAVQEAGSPRLSAASVGASGETGVAPTAFLELQVDDALAGCDDDPPADAPAATVRSDGGCAVEIPVDLSVTGGDVSFQLDAYVQLNFARRDAPGVVTITVAPAE
jgi:hypothetical protein